MEQAKLSTLVLFLALMLRHSAYIPVLMHCVAALHFLIFDFSTFPRQ